MHLISPEWWKSFPVLAGQPLYPTCATMAFRNTRQLMKLNYRWPLFAGEHGLTIARCAESRFLSTTTAESPRNRRTKTRAPDTPYVKRRTSYLEELSRLRNAFHAETIADRIEDHALLASRKAALEAKAEARQASRRAKSEALQPRIIAEREAQRVRSEELRAYNFKRFEESRRVIRERRMERVAALEAASADWITEQNLPTKVDELLDSIFIAQEAADHARVGTPEEQKTARA